MSTDTTTPAETAKPKHNKLELIQQFRLLDWCRQHEEQVKTLPDTQLAEMAASVLRFKVTVANLTSTRQAAGIEKLKPTAPPTVEERLQQVETTLQKLFQSLELAGTFIGMTLPAGLPLTSSPPLPVSESPSLGTLPGLEPIPDNG